MAKISAGIKRGLLNQIFLNAQSSETPLLGALQTFQATLFNGIKTGQIIASTAGAGYSVGFRPPQLPDQYKQEDVFELSQEFLEVFTSAVSTLAAGSPPNNNPDDPTIFTTMMADDRLQSVTEFMGDNLYARQPFVGTIGA